MCVHSRSQTCLPSPSFPPPVFLLCEGGVRPCRQSSGSPSEQEVRTQRISGPHGNEEGPGPPALGASRARTPRSPVCVRPDPAPCGAESWARLIPPHGRPAPHPPPSTLQTRPLTAQPHPAAAVRPLKASQRLPPQRGQDETARPAARLVLEERSMRRRTTGAAAGHVGVCVASHGPQHAAPARPGRRTCPHLSTPGVPASARAQRAVLPQAQTEPRPPGAAASFSRVQVQCQPRGRVRALRRHQSATICRYSVSLVF